MWDSITGAFNGAMNLLDLPGSSVRDLVAGENPWDQWSSPLSADHRVSGAQLVSKYAGSDPNSIATTIGGIGAEMLLDPTNLLGGAGVLRRVMAARKAVQANKAIDVANDASDAWRALPNAQKPEFQNWFKGSQIVDETGSPLTAYHGTPYAGFDAFEEGSSPSLDSGWLGKGHYFSTSPETAGYYANRSASYTPGVYPVHLSIQNPLLLNKKPIGINGLLDDGVLNDPVLRQQFQAVVSKFPVSPPETQSWGVVGPSEAARYDDYMSNAFTYLTKEAGYDGVVAPFKNGEKEILAFNAPQIKSIFNKGAFDPSSRDLLDHIPSGYEYQSPLSVPSAMRQLQALAAYNVGVRDRGVTLE